MKILITIAMAVFMTAIGFTQADPVSRGIYNYISPSPEVTAYISFQLENGDAANISIPKNTVEWTLVFPNDVLYVRDGIFTGTPFYEFSRGVNPENPTEYLVVIRNQEEVPKPEVLDPTVSVFEVAYKVEGKTVDIQGTIKMMNNTLMEYEEAVGNLDAANDFASSPIEFEKAVENYKENNDKNEPGDLTSTKDTDLGNGINDLLQVHPNPTAGLISLKASASFDVKKVEVYSQVGILLRTLPITPEEKIDLSDQLGGIYFLKFMDRDGNLIITKRIIKI